MSKNWPMIWSIVRVQLLVAGLIGGALYLLGRPSDSMGVLYGAVLGTVNALSMIGRLENSVPLDPKRGKGFLQRGAMIRFALVLVFMSTGFYFFRFHVVSLLAGFVLFQVIAMVFIWREIKSSATKKAA